MWKAVHCPLLRAQRRAVNHARAHPFVCVCVLCLVFCSSTVFVQLFHCRKSAPSSVRCTVSVRQQSPPALALPADATLCVQHGYRFKGSWNDSQASPVADGVTCKLYR